MWRIIGIIFFSDKDHFLHPDKKSFDKERIIEFLNEKGIALYDTASAVRRLQDNASDKFLEIIKPTDIDLLLKQLPKCRAIVTTGQKATDTLRQQIHVSEPPIGGKSSFEYNDRTLYLYTRVRDNILKSKEQKNIQPTKGGHKMVTCQNYVSLFYRQITSCPSDGGIS